MAAPHSVDPAALLEQHLQGASPDLVREMIATLANAMMSAQADLVCGAGYGQRSPERTNRRNGYRGTAPTARVRVGWFAVRTVGTRAHPGAHPCVTLRIRA